MITLPIIVLAALTGVSEGQTLLTEEEQERNLARTAGNLSEDSEDLTLQTEEERKLGIFGLQRPLRSNDQRNIPDISKGCICPGGTPAFGNKCTSRGAHICTSCSSANKLKDKKCTNPDLVKSGPRSNAH